jgi:hypothetical protein
VTSLSYDPSQADRDPGRHTGRHAAGGGGQTLATVTEDGDSIIQVHCDSDAGPASD